MPNMDGLELAGRIRRMAGLGSQKMLMLSAFQESEVAAQGRKVELVGWLIRPVDSISLIKFIAHLVTGQAVTPPAEAVPALEDRPAAGQTQPLNILLAEDTEDNRLLIKAYLKRTSHRLDLAENGAIACDMFKVGRYDLVLMDMQMPVMDGYAATHAIRQWEGEHHRPPTPIIALTAHALIGDEQKSLEAGCTAHLTKPIKKPTLLAAIVEYTRSPVT